MLDRLEAYLISSRGLVTIGPSKGNKLKMIPPLVGAVASLSDRCGRSAKIEIVEALGATVQ